MRDTLTYRCFACGYTHTTELTKKQIELKRTKSAQPIQDYTDLVKDYRALVERNRELQEEVHFQRRRRTTKYW